MTDSKVKAFEKKFISGIKEQGLAYKKDKIIVACSGGKDSTTVLYLLKKYGYNVEGLIIDLLIGDWSGRNLDNVKSFCEGNGIKLNVVSMRDEFGCSICYIRSCVQSKAKLGNCSICGVIKRWLLNKKSRELGATRLATGHNLDDEAENILMTFFKGKPEIMMNTGPMSPIIGGSGFVPRIKPLYFFTNDEIREYSKAMKFPVVYEPCPCSEGTYRRYIRKWLAEVTSGDPEMKRNIVMNFLTVSKLMRSEMKPREGLRVCRRCGEPSRNETCRRCEYIGIMSG